MKILHVLDHSIPLHSGYAFRTRSILEHQRALGWDTYHLTGPKQGDCEAVEEDVDGFRFHRTRPLPPQVASLPVAGQWVVVRALERRIGELLDKLRVDVIHAHSPVLNALAALRAGRRARVPVVYEVRALWEDAAVDHGTSRAWGMRYRLSRALESDALRRCQAVTTICEGLRQELIGRGLEPEKVTVIPNAVNTAAFRFDTTADEDLRRRLGLEGVPVLGFIGSFYAYEGLDVLIGALPKAIEKTPNTKLLLVGGGPQERRLKDLVRELGLLDHVIFTGRIPHTEVDRYYDLIDILVYPRLSMRLTELVTPLKPLEAMAKGRLVLASDVGGHRELIRDGETGVLFRSGSSDSLATAVTGLLHSQQRWTLMRLAARAFVERERNWPASVQRYVNVYKAAIEGFTDGQSLHTGDEKDVRSA